jgi:hypothetical protein
MIENDTTRRYPRTLQEAFGPYAEGWQVCEEEEESTIEKIVSWASAILGAGLLIYGVWVAI